MPDNEKEALEVNIKCKHCGNVNKVDLTNFLLSMRANHFFKLYCNADRCGKKTLVTYKLETYLMTASSLPQDTLSNLTIE